MVQKNHYTYLVDGMDGMDGRVIKVSFNFLYTLWIYKILFETHVRGVILEIVIALKKQYTYNVPSGSSSSASTTRPEGPSLRMDGMDGWDGMGWDGMGYQKCPSIFFILCVYIYPISNLLYM